MTSFRNMFIVVYAALALFAANLYADSQSTVTVSGRATDTKGRPLRGQKLVQMDFYDNAQAQVPFKTLSKTLTMTDGGVFSYSVSGEELPDLPDELWVRISIQGQTPLPLQRITSSFFARSAAKAKGAKEEFRIYGKNGNNYVSLKVESDLTTTTAYTLPSADGADGDVLSTDGNAKLSWRKPAAGGGGTAPTIDGSNIGSGSGVFAGKADNNLRFKSIVGKNGVSVSASGDTITIESSASTQVPMDKRIYDQTGVDGVVDNAERLGGFGPEFFRNASNINTGVMSEGLIDPSIARLNQVPYRNPQDLQQALSGNYAPMTHTHSAFDITSGILMEIFIDPAIARDSEIIYKSQADLRNALDESYAAKDHTHNASQINQDPTHRFISDGERVQWSANSGDIGAASAQSIPNTLVRRDSNGSVNVQTIGASMVHLGPLSITAHPQTPAGTQLQLPPSIGEDGQVLSSDGQGGMAWRSIAVSNDNAVRDSARNLTMNNLESAPADGVRVRADEMILQNSSGKVLRVQGINLSANLASALDSGAEEASSWYHVWLVSNGQAVAIKFSLSSSQPNVAAGSYIAYVGAAYNNASGDLATFVQRGKSVLCDSVTVLQSGTSFTYTSVSLAQAVPANAINVMGDLGLSQDFSVYSQGIYISANANGLGEQRFVQYTEAGLTDELASGFQSMLAAPQTLYYRCYHRLGSAYCTSDRTTVFVRIKGWSY